MSELRVEISDDTEKRIKMFMDKLGLRSGQKGRAVDLAFWALNQKEIEDISLLLTEFENYVLGEDD